MSPKRPFVIGLTGSIGMGKTTTAQLFADLGIPVWDADAAVDRLYSKGGGGVEAVSQLRPEAVVGGVVDRDHLRNWITQTPTALQKLERVVHPLVAADRNQFIDRSSAPIILLDIPLLFETGADEIMDMVVVVSTGPDKNIQRERVLSRPGMTEDLFQAMLKKQLPDIKKRARADVVIPTLSLETAQIAVAAVIGQIREKLGNA